MDAAPPSRLITAQHHAIDQGIKGIVDGNGAVTALAASLALLRRHLYIEEVVLFPPLVKTGLTMPVFVMKREHGQMWPLIQHLETDVAQGKSVAELHEPARQLFQLLQMHNPKEEQIVYTAADKLAREEGDGTLTKSLEDAKLPDGWTCQMAGKGMGSPFAGLGGGLGKVPGNP